MREAYAKVNERKAAEALLASTRSSDLGEGKPD
jgi:hypothetical protein